MAVRKPLAKGLYVFVEIRNATKQKGLERTIVKAIEKTVPFFRKKGRFAFSVALTGTRAMRALSLQWKGKDAATDVLSFGFSEQGRIGFPAIPAQAESMGEIILCVPYAKKQATLLGIGLKKNIATLASHGAIHLFGLDHERSSADYDKTMFIQHRVITMLA